MSPNRSNRRRPSPMGPGLLVCLLLLGAGPAARADFCAGQREALRNMLQLGGQRLWTDAQRLGERLVGRVLTVCRRQAPRLALWVLAVQSRRMLAEALAAEDFKLTGLARLQDPWLRAGELRGLLDMPRAANEAGELRRVLDETVGTWAACLAIQRRSPAPCAMAEKMSSDLGAQCRSPVVTLWATQRHCNPPPSDFFEFLAAARRRWCARYPDDQSAVCKRRQRNPKMTAICRALNSGDDKACRGSGLGQADAVNCLAILAVQRYLTGRLPATELERALAGFSLTEAIEQGRYPGRDCLHLALSLFDRAAAPHFLVRPGPLGPLPEFP